MGEGGGAGIHAVCAAVQDALRGNGDAIVWDSSNPYHRVWEMLTNPAEAGGRVAVVESDVGSTESPKSGGRGFAAAGSGLS
jgi:hypothetical protein